MGTTLTGTTPQDTYDSLIKVTDNGPLSGTLKTLTDGLGNDSALALSTGAASVTGTLAVSGASTLSSSFRINTAAGDFITLNDGNVAFGAALGLGSGGDFVLSSIASGALTERFRITRSTGVVELAQGQIKFPATQVPSADPNTLDDYEEGTWTMGVSFGGASTGVTYSSNTGTYTKIGRQVTVNGLMVLTSKGSSTGVARITGLPFTVGNANSFYAIAPIHFENISFTGQLQPIAIINDTVIVIQYITEAGVNDNASNTNFTDTSRIIINFTYFV